MPIHDWARDEAGVFRMVHNAWLIHLMDRLNAEVLPPGHYAMTDSRVDIYAPDLSAVRRHTAPVGGELAVLPAPDRQATVSPRRSLKHRRLRVYDDCKQVVAIFELVSPANKDCRRTVGEFAGKVADFLASGVNVTVADLLPPGPADPGGMHPPVWKALNPKAQAAGPPADRPLTFAAYQGGSPADARLYYAAVGQPAPPVPLFLKYDQFVLLPLEETYMTTIDRLPAELRDTLG
jgi:hypothetical protein